MLQAAVNAGFVWLAVVAVLASLVGAFYYLRIVKLMYFDDAVETARRSSRAATRALLLSVNGLALLVLRHPAAAADGPLRRRADAVAVF